jgi:hypothetical protein
MNYGGSKLGAWDDFTSYSPRKSNLLRRSFQPLLALQGSVRSTEGEGLAESPPPSYIHIEKNGDWGDQVLPSSSKSAGPPSIPHAQQSPEHGGDPSAAKAAK